MSSWFMRHRQVFIASQLKTFGQIRRADICAKFQVTAAVASADIAAFIEGNPEVMIYDGKAKCYVLDQDAIVAQDEG